MHRRLRGCFDDKAVVRVEDDLVAGLEDRIANRFAIDDAAFGRAEIAQHDCLSAQVDAGMALGERGILDANVRIGRASDQAGLFEGEAAAVVSATDAAQDDARIRCGFHRRIGQSWRKLGTGLSDQYDLDSVDIDRVAQPQHRHAPYRAPVDVHAASRLFDRHPHAPAVEAEAHQRLTRIVDDCHRTVGVTANAVNARAQRELGACAGESEGDLFHGGQSSRSPNIHAMHAWIRSPSGRTMPVHRVAGAFMSTIEIRHPHALSPEQARQAVEDFAIKLGERFGMDYRWEGEVLHFKRSGVDGQISLLPGALQVNARLGLLFAAMKGSIEQEMRRVLRERLG